MKDLLLDPIPERRYVALVRLCDSITAASDCKQLARSVAGPLTSNESAPPVRLWAIGAEGPNEVSRYPADYAFPSRGPRDLRLPAASREGLRADDYLLIGMQAATGPIGVLEIGIDYENFDFELARLSARLLALRFAPLEGEGDTSSIIGSASSDSDISEVISNFAAQAKRTLDHDRLSAYLITPDGRAVERFAVATSPILPGEGVIVPFTDFGLRHIILTNRPLVSGDLATDSRIIGREDRVIAQAGFHGLLSVPLRLNGQPFGVLNFVSRTPGFYKEEDAEIAQQLADEVSVFFDHLHRERDARAWTRHEVLERERARLARDLHDTLSRAVPSLTKTATELADRVPEEDAQAREQAVSLRQEAELVLADVHRALVGLVPPALDSHSLRDVMTDELRSFDECASTSAHLSIEGDTVNLPSAVQRAVYRVLQEALANVAAHAEANNVEVSLGVGRDLMLTIEDDGAGFVSDTSGPAGLGLRFMAERANSLGGRLEIQSSPGEGTTVVLELFDVDQLSDYVEQPRDGLPATVKSTGVSLRVFLVEPHPLLRAGLMQLLADGPEIRVVGTAPTVDDGHRQIVRLRPDVVLVDVDEVDPDGAMVRTIKRSAPTTAVVGISDVDRKQYERLVEAGAAGVLEKGLSSADLISGLATAAAGGDVGRREWATMAPAIQSLTKREREVLALIAAGQTNAEIGAHLSFATKTIERHVATVVDKLGAKNRAHAAALAISRGLVRLPSE